jgi:REP element-mobilizing transposase RayT
MVNNANFRHKNIRLAATSYVGLKAYFVTLCSDGRRTVFNHGQTCRNVLNLLRQEVQAKCFSIPAYCLMPDHLHFLACGLHEKSYLLSLVKSFRIKSSRAYARAFGDVLWQKKFFDRILRSSVSLESVAWYIWLNPVRAGLVITAKAYPYSGSFTNAELFGMPPTQIWRPEWKEMHNTEARPPQKAAATKT